MQGNLAVLSVVAKHASHAVLSEFVSRGDFFADKTYRLSVYIYCSNGGIAFFLLLNELLSLEIIVLSFKGDLVVFTASR